MFLTRSASSIFFLIGLLLALYCIIDIIANHRPRPALWIIAVLILPFASIIYLAIKIAYNAPEDKAVKLPEHTHPAGSKPPYQQANQWQNTYSEGGLAPGQYRPEAHEPLSAADRAFRTGGTILGVLAIVLGSIVVGLVVLFMMALASWGSSK